MPLQVRQVVLRVVRRQAALAGEFAEVQAGELLDALEDPAPRLEGQQVVAPGEDEVERQGQRRPARGYEGRRAAA